ncbi:MAG: hypothetical protein AAF891_04500 [Pseudomonadota bacterium]
MTRKLTALGAILATTTMAFAMTGADANGDGVLTWEEVQAAAPDVSQDMFNTADADNDGVLGEGEVADAIASGLLPQLDG